MADNEHFTGQDEGKVGTIATLEDARAAHRLASADPEQDGTMTGPAHEAKYGLQRADGSAEHWRAQGVHPLQNRALLPGEDGWTNLAGAEDTSAVVVTDDTAAASGQNTNASRPSSSRS